MATPREILTQRLKLALEKSFPDTAPEVVPATDPRFGDYQTNVAMVLARKNRVSPREIARQIVTDLDVRDISERARNRGCWFHQFSAHGWFSRERGRRCRSRSETRSRHGVSKPERLSSISVPRTWRSRCTSATFGARSSEIVWLVWPAFSGTTSSPTIIWVTGAPSSGGLFMDGSICSMRRLSQQMRSPSWSDFIAK